MSEPKRPRHGEMTEIVIGTVVNAGVDGAGITARELAEKLTEWGYPMTRHQCAVMLVGLARAGRIERVRTGLYKGV